MQWILSLEFPYLTGHHVLPDIPNNYCTGVNRQDTLMLSSQWQPKEGLTLGNEDLYCSMNREVFGDCIGGGWMLVMKIDGKQVMKTQ